MRRILTISLLCLATAFSIKSSAAERHVVLMVWDGMRPDFVTASNTPTLHALAGQGVFFAHNHPAYISSTEVNGTELATGAYPEHSDIIGNREFRPSLFPLSAFGTESLEAMREADARGHYLDVPTLAELLQKQGKRTLIAGSKPVVLLHDRATRPADATNLVLFEGRTLPENRVAELTSVLGPFADKGNTKTNRDQWTARAATEILWKDEVPAFTVLWMAEPDNTQHGTGVGSAASLAAIRNSDYALSLVIAALKAKGVYETTDIFIVSDHGFSTISGSVDMVEHLRHAGFNVSRQFKTPPNKGDVLLVGLGGSVLLYVTGHDDNTIDGLVKALQTEDSVGTIFTAKARKGTFAQEDAMIHSKDAPDIVFSFRWSTATNANGTPGTVISEAQGSNMSTSLQKATHASLSPFDMHNTLIAAGPDFRKGLVSDTPSGNVDVAPTILHILGAPQPATMDGRILNEALNAPPGNPPQIRKTQLRAQAQLPSGDWKQTLDVVEVNGVRYLDQGTGEFTRQPK